MEKPEIIAHTNRLSLMFLIIISALLLPIFRTQLERKPLNWEMFNPNRTNGGIFFFLMAGCIFLVFKYFDRQPQLIIDNSGISKRKYYWPYINKYFYLPWNSICHFYFVTNGRLIIELKETGREIKIWITELDIPSADILNAIRKYAEINNIQDLGLERSKRAS